MQCNTNYTGSIENFKYINLNVLGSYKKLFPDAILGLSDHTPGHETVLGAVPFESKLLKNILRMIHLEMVQTILFQWIQKVERKWYPEQDFLSKQWETELKKLKSMRKKLQCYKEEQLDA